MATIFSTPLANAILDTGPIKTQVTSFFVYLYDGPVPVNADAAATGCTKLVKIGAGSGGTTGATWATSAASRILVKNTGETWTGLILASSTPTFYRICMGSDDGSGAVTTEKRIQGTAGGPGNDIELLVPGLVANGTNTQGLSIFSIQIP